MVLLGSDSPSGALPILSVSAQRRLAFSGAIVNALSERLVVSTVHEGERYRVVFSKGMLVSLLAKAPSEVPLGTNWLTFLPDGDLLGGAVSSAEAAEIVTRVGLDTLR
jgi:DNA gyrase/topoisomerase IV subunit B